MLTNILSLKKNTNNTKLFTHLFTENLKRTINKYMGTSQLLNIHEKGSEFTHRSINSIIYTEIKTTLKN